jgi:hypothetical protein
MKLNPILLLSLAFAASTGASQARAAILVQGSSFLLTLETTAGSGNTQSELITVNGNPFQFDFGSVPVSVTETDTPIGGGGETIAITIAASQDIFPSSTPGAGDWYLGIGVGSSPLQLSEPVTLTSALLTAIIPPGPDSFPIDYQFLGYIADPSPWDGAFLGGGELGGFVYATGYNIQTVELDLTVDPIPEPSSVVLFLAGLAGFVVLARKRPSPQASSA